MSEKEEPAELSAATGLEGFELLIGEDGTVTFIDFPPEMLEIARALNPDDPLVCERTELLEKAREED